MKPALNLLFIFIVVPFFACAQQVLLYENDFENPNQTPVANCGPDLDATDVNVLWSGTGAGAGSGTFLMINTVETILINGPDNLYTDPTGTGGNYCLSMLSTVQDDKAALTFDAQNLPFANISFDLSAVDAGGCGGPFGIDTPVINIKVYDSPGGVFDISAPGLLLDEVTASGHAPVGNGFTFHWATVMESLDISNATDGNISIMFDLLQSPYAALDNLYIESSITSVGKRKQTDVLFYPNPSDGIVNINGIRDGSVVVYDATGRSVLETKISGDSRIDITNFTPGIYFFELKDSRATVLRKAVIRL